MFKKLYYSVVGDPNEKIIKSYHPVVEEVNALEPEFERKTNDELRAMTDSFRARIQEATADSRARLAEAEQVYLAVLGTDEQKFARVEVNQIKKEMLAEEKEILDDILPEAFAAVREAAKRTVGLRHYDVQLIGGMVLHSGTIAEMKTGEGKTLVATLPIYLNALAGRGVPAKPEPRPPQRGGWCGAGCTEVEGKSSSGPTGSASQSVKVSRCA